MYGLFYGLLLKESRLALIFYLTRYHLPWGLGITWGSVFFCLNVNELK